MTIPTIETKQKFKNTSNKEHNFIKVNIRKYPEL